MRASNEGQGIEKATDDLRIDRNRDDVLEKAIRVLEPDPVDGVNAFRATTVDFAFQA